MGTHPNTERFEPESYYHLYNHAVGSENLFRNRDNYFYFLAKLKTHTAPVCKVYAYSLLPNHFHLLIRTRSESEVYNLRHCQKRSEKDFHKAVMQPFMWMLNGYAQAYNKVYNRRGALFIDYMRRKKVAEERYFTQLVYYIHRNPVHHGFCEHPGEWEFSSYRALLSLQPTALERESVLDWFGSRDSFVDFHCQQQDAANEGVKTFIGFKTL
ncbi:MAG: hypothetical protein MUD08_14290 [Cytophagales bacterium]|jgi:REP element-mobilizing transposase RayT|nr:hypothetical protein [Cytophagales bacterium]